MVNEIQTVQRSGPARDGAPRMPDLPRDTVRTRMPPAPAPGGRVIHVGPPAGHALPHRVVRARVGLPVAAVMLILIVGLVARRRGWAR
jgi:hypothetical protein